MTICGLITVTDVTLVEVDDNDKDKDNLNDNDNDSDDNMWVNPCDRCHTCGKSADSLAPDQCWKDTFSPKV